MTSDVATGQERARPIGLGRTAVIAPLLLASSGAAALVYQVLWIKQLALVLGVDVYAVTIGLSGFFAGLAVGSAWLGRLADRVTRPFRVFAALELGTAILGVVTTVALAGAAPWFVPLESRTGWAAWVGVLAMVAVPAALMGGTLPVLTRALAARGGRIDAAGGWLYAGNTAGAIAGAVLSTFVLIPWLGVRGSAIAAAALNVAAALGGLALDRGAPARGDLGGAPAPVAFARGAHLALWLYAVAGGLALGYEVVWSQVIVQLTSTRSFAFAVVLATYLAGLAMGSALYARRARALRDPWGAFALLVSAAGLVALLEVLLLGGWLIALQSWLEAAVLTATGSALAGRSARFAAAAGAVVLLPTVLLGAAFPAALRLVAGGAHVGRDVGRVVAFNTVGGIAGTIVTGFVLVPALGLVRTLAALAVAAGLVGIVAISLGPGAGRGAWRATVAIGLATALIAILVPADRLATLLPAARGGALLFYEESAGGAVAVVEQAASSSRFRRLYIEGVSNSGDTMPSLRYMRLQALLPLLIHSEDPRSALVIGLGTGITAGALLQYPGLERAVCAELMPAVVRAAPLFRGNFGAASDPRLEIRVRDGRRELLSRPDRYDLITLEPPPPSAAGVVNLYSRDFYALAASRLTPDGLLAQWWPLAAQNDEDSRSLVRSFLDVFPHVSLWTTELHEALLIGSRRPMAIDVARVSARFDAPAVSAALREIGVGSPASLLATWVTDRGGLERYVDGAPPVTDDRPRIEHAGWVRPDEITRVLPRLLAARVAPPIAGADDRFRAAVTEERDRLWQFYRAGLLAYAHETAAASRALRRVLSEDAGNPYYRWFAVAAPSS